jgi:thiamine-phosphate pyrophosphorylase
LNAGTGAASSPFPDVVVITDPAWSDDDLAERTQSLLGAVPHSSVGIQIRDKTRSARAVLALAERLKRVCLDFGAPLYVNDRLDIALALGADGVHLGGDSVDVADARRLVGPVAFVSTVAHASEDVARAVRSGATAALVSPIFDTPGKGAPRGTSFITDARSHSRTLRLYALGGVDPGNASACVSAGADGVAVIRAVWQAEDPGAAACALVDAVRSVGRAV